ncbi:MAG: hypothetical protein ACRDZR_18935, partial [Acidimicrobiales bacterium]
VAEHARGKRWWRAAVGNAAASGIAAGDVIGYATVGARSSSPDHRDALEVLREAGADAALLDALRRLLAEKNPAQYLESWAGDGDLALDAVECARRLLAAADDAWLHAEQAGWPHPDDGTNPVVEELRRPRET